MESRRILDEVNQSLARGHTVEGINHIFEYAIVITAATVKESLDHSVGQDAVRRMVWEIWNV
jgi:hypothetical protein